MKDFNPFSRPVPFFLASMLILGAQASAQDTVGNALSRFNVITTDYTINNETQGSAFVAGTYSIANVGRFGLDGGAAANDSDNILFLNNGTSGSGQTQILSGSVISRTAVNSSNFQLDGNAPGDPSISSNVGDEAFSSALSSAVGSSAGINTAQFLLTLGNASANLSDLSSTGTAGLADNGAFTFSYDDTSAQIDGSNIGIFNVAADELFNGASNFDRIAVNFNNADSILINVSGLNVDIDKNFTDGFVNNESKILFNFFEAETITVDANVRGTVFAPTADILQNRVIDGSVVSLGLTQNNEIHALNFAGPLPPSLTDAIPEPSSGLLALLSSCLLLYRRR